MSLLLLRNYSYPLFIDLCGKQGANKVSLLSVYGKVDVRVMIFVFIQWVRSNVAKGMEYNYAMQASSEGIVTKFSFFLFFLYFFS